MSSDDAGPTSPDTETATSAFDPAGSDGGSLPMDSAIPEAPSEPTDSLGSEGPTRSPDGGEVDAGSETATDANSAPAEETRTDDTSISGENSGPAETTGHDSTPTGATTQTNDENTSNGDPSETGDTLEPDPSCAQDERPYQAHCYFFGDGAKTWDSARQACRARGEAWELSAVTSQEEHTWVSKQLGDDAWIGGFKTDDKWLWSATDTVFWQGGEDGEPVNGAFTWWEDTEPDAEGEAAQCLRYSDDSGEWAWADMPCRREYRYVCER